MLAAVANATSPFPPTLNINLDPTYGPDVIGTYLACIFYGMTIIQTSVFFMTFSLSDPLFIKLVVLTNLTMSGTQLLSIASSNYTTLVEHFGNLRAMQLFSWGTQAGALLTVMIICLVQCFFLWRIFRFSKTWIILIPTGALVLTSFGLGLTSAGKVMHTPTVIAASKLKSINLANDVVMAVTDILLAAILVFFLKRSESGVATTGLVIKNLIHYTIGTGAFTALLAFTGMVVRLALPNSTANQALYTILPHSYVNALLVTLNLRKIARKPWTPSDGVVELSAFRATGSVTVGNSDSSGVLAQSDKVLLNDTGLLASV